MKNKEKRKKAQNIISHVISVIDTPGLSILSTTIQVLSGSNPPKFFKH